MICSYHIRSSLHSYRRQNDFHLLLLPEKKCLALTFDLDKVNDNWIQTIFLSNFINVDLTVNQKALLI